MNLLVAMVFALQVMLSVMASIGNYIFLKSHEPRHWYLKSTGWVLDICASLQV